MESVVVTESDSRSIVDNVKFNTTPLQEEVAIKKRRRVEAEAESKRLVQEAYDREIHEQLYKQLMHLLNTSKVYSKFIINKIDDPLKKNAKKVNKKGRSNSQTDDENVPPQSPQAKGKKRKLVPHNYNIWNYIPEDIENEIHKQKNRMNLSEEEIVEELVNDSEPEKHEITNVAFKIPKYFNGDLRDYQKEGLQWLKVLYENGINGILGDEMGLGKTVQVIALICHLVEKQQAGPYLIIAPLSTIPNWMIEFERFAPQLPVVVFHDKQNERSSLRKQIKKMYPIGESFKTQPVVLTTYETPLWEKEFIVSQNWRYIIVDEGQRIKNHECQLIQILKKCTSMNRLLMTGTPLQNNLAELWSLLNFLLPEIFDDLAVFESWFNAAELQYDEGTKKLLKQEEEKHVLSSLREILKPFMLRREKSDVCSDIPQKKELIVYAPLTELQHCLYQAVLNRDLETFNKRNDDLIIPSVNGVRPKRKCVLKNLQNIDNNKQFHRAVSPSLMQESDDSSNGDTWKAVKTADKKSSLIWEQYTDVADRNVEFLIRAQFQTRSWMYKKIVNHPYLIHCPLDATGMPKVDENLVKSSGKLLVLDAMLAKLKSRGHKVLLFSTMTMILDMLEDYLSLRDYRYVRLDGATKIETRKQNIRDFNVNPDLFLFLISTRAGGVGLNLAAADTVIMYDSDWNPQADIQAMARCHRIGQTRPVAIYRLCTKGTIDEKIINYADAKRVLEKMVISKQIKKLNLNSKETLLELQKLLDSKEYQIVTSEKEVFTDTELNNLLDRSDITKMEDQKPSAKS